MRLLIALASVALGAAVETLTALTPESLRANWPNGAVEETRPALFGQPQYGRRYEGRVTYATVGDRDGCLPLTRDSNWPAEGTPLILMVDRGNCTFVTKVRHAENAGAIAVIVVDNVELSSEPFMADDGTGWELTIPSVLVHRHDGLKFEALATQGLPMTAALQWNSPKREIVEYTLWTSSADWSAIRFKRRWLPAFRSLTNSRFTPRYGFYNGTADGCFNTNNCEDFCTNNGRYCDWDEWQIGKLVIQENVRQLCIWQIYGASRPELWWNYVAYFDQECQHTFNDACSRAGQTSVGIDVNEVAQCVTASGGTDDNGGVNTLLEAELEALNVAEDVWWLPTISVNGEPYRGTLNCADVTDHGSCGVLTAICDGYPAGRSPSICRTSAGCPIGEIRDECGVCGGQGVNDACGQCMPRSNPLFNKTCAGCDGVPNSGKVRDGCGVCGGNGVFEQCVNVLLQPLRNEIQQLRAQINPACLTQGSDRRAASADCVREPTRGGSGSAVGVGVAVTLSLAVLVIIGVVAIRRRNSNLYRMSDYTQQEDNHRAALLDS